MGAAASVDVRHDASFSKSLELQAAANWHRIIQHANSAGPTDKDDRISPALDQGAVFVTRGRQHLFDVSVARQDYGGSHVLPDGGEVDIFKTGERSIVDEYVSLKERSALFKSSESTPVVMTLKWRSGSTVLLEWDAGGAVAQSVDSLSFAEQEGKNNKDLLKQIRYEVIVALGKNVGNVWQLLFSGSAEGRSLAIRCPEYNTRYRFRCRRLIPAPPSSEGSSKQAWLPGTWGPEIAVRSGPGPPSPATRVTLLEVGCSAVKVTWKAPHKDNGLPILYYTIRLYAADHFHESNGKTTEAQDCTGDGLMFEYRVDTYSDHFKKPLSLSAPTFPLSSDTSYRLSITPANRAGECIESISGSSSSAVLFTTRRLNELSLTPWAFVIDEDTHEGYYRHLASGSVSHQLPPGALLDEDLSFVNKLIHFKSCISRRRQALKAEDGIDDVNGEVQNDQLAAPLVINRENILLDSLTLLGYCDSRELQMNPIRIQFDGEKGVDNGGVAKDWFTSVARALIDPKYGVLVSYDGSVVDVSSEENRGFKTDIVPVKSDKAVVFTPVSSIPLIGLNVATVNAYMGGEHGDTDTFHSVGMFLGKALVDERTIGYNVDPIVLKWMLHEAAKDEAEKHSDQKIGGKDALQEPPGMMELARSDFRLYTGLQWVLNASQSELASSELYFTVTRAMATTDAAVDVVELVPGGGSILVDSENKFKFSNLLLHWLVKDRYEPALTSLLEGFRSIVPPHALRYLSVNELSSMLAGRPVVDIIELRKNAIHSGIKFSKEHELAKWFWEILETMDQKALSNLLLFCTGSYYMPISGYSPPFNVTMHDFSEDGKTRNDDRLPEAHTCFNQIVFPEYTSKETMFKKLLYTIENNGSIFTIL